ncbi:zinc finger and SCAN domain-containing protein 20-like isoform X1 [Hippocampus comes]|uniref:zinc finger and SCAN domain-containing protein 20-like isoform X1 n=1 Tax=Hippocampus comes TaxID=109280 RepID=UPI00094F000B|nr:PREDICTED: zinc finger and SCAN domain-containing protein 20-like isoform X1 [Hippocampus comes]
MEINISLHSKLSSIMESMAESAMAELCKAVDEDTVELRLELSRLKTLNSALTEKVDTLECELTAARSDVNGLPRSHRTVAIQTDDDVNESVSPVIEGVFGQDWCLNLWKDKFRAGQKVDAQQVDADMMTSMPLDCFSPGEAQDLEKGAEFFSFESFSEAIERWQRSNFVELYKRSSRTVENAKKRARKKSYSDDLVFAELDFACAHGSKGPDLKRCPFTIKVRVTPDGRKLYIKDISPANCHNHELSQVVLTGESENSDVILVKVEDYLEGTAGSFSQETLSQETHNSTPWTFQEVQTFLGILAEEEVQRELVGAVRNRRVFQLVSQRMAAEGFQRTCGQCQMKCKKLRCEYRKIKKQNRPKAWRWFELVDAVYGHRPAVNKQGVDTATLLEAMMESVDDEELFSEEVEQMPAWPVDISMDADSKNHFYENDGTGEQAIQLSDSPEDGCFEYVVEDGQSKLTVQTSSSSGGKKYICLRCNIVFYNPNTLMVHQRAHQPYWCDVCKEQFETKAKLKHHKCEVAPNKCRLCGKTWASQSALRTHMVVHTGDKRFVCRFCGQRFAQKGSMRSHLIRTHVGCGECGMKFEAKTQLLRHLLKHKRRTI